MDRLYCDVIIRRWQSYGGGIAILASTGETFDAVAPARGSLLSNARAASRAGKKASEADAEDPAFDKRVGYCAPPLASRFRPGQSGNPRGRPKGARNLSTVVASALGERVAVTENGRRRRITKLEAAIKQLVNRAAAGEARAIQLLIQLAQANEVRAPHPDGGRVDDADAIVMAELRRRMGRQP